MALQAGGVNRAVEAVVLARFGELVARREAPGLVLGVVGDGRLDQMAVSPNEIAEAVHTRANDKGQPVSAVERRQAGRVGLGLSLVEAIVALFNDEPAVEPLAHDRRGGSDQREERSIDLSHRGPHRRCLEV